MENPGAVVPRGMSFSILWKIADKRNGSDVSVRENALRPGHSMPITVIKAPKHES